MENYDGRLVLHSIESPRAAGSGGQAVPGVAVMGHGVQGRLVI
jgi:hypothetical protein